MKKIIMFILALSLLLGLCAVGTSAAGNEMDMVCEINCIKDGNDLTVEVKAKNTDGLKFRGFQLDFSITGVNYVSSSTDVDSFTVTHGYSELDKSTSIRAAYYDMAERPAGTVLEEGTVLVRAAFTLRDGNYRVTEAAPLAYLVNDDGSRDLTAYYPKYTVSGSFKSTEHTCPFVDIKPADYFHDAVEWAVSRKITNGTSDTTFSPYDTCTRAQAVTFLWRANGCPEPQTANNPFADVSADAYYYKAVLWAVEKGITKGTAATMFSPNDPCTRAQIVTLQYRAAGEPAATGALFSDVKADAYYAAAVKWAVAQGVTKGTSDTTFSPDDNCTRGQIVTFIYRQIEK